MSWLEPNAPLMRGLRLTAVSLAVLFLTGLLAYPLERGAWKRVSANLNELRVEEVESALGQGVILGVLGGFRTLMADLLFIRMYTHWEKKEWTKVEALMPVLTSVDPRSLYFWINANRIVAYDIPVMRIREINAGFKRAGSDRVLTPEEEQAIHAEQGLKAIDSLQQGLTYHPDESTLMQDIASTYLNKVGDVEKAAEWYLRAWQTPTRRYYQARLHAQLVYNLGRVQEALDFLIAHYREIPKDAPYARASVVLERIREMEDELGLPESERFQPDAP
ncbi:MAG: tetratricopeptide repeat protein [Opitutales bacterium]